MPGFRVAHVSSEHLCPDLLKNESIRTHLNDLNLVETMGRHLKYDLRYHRREDCDRGYTYQIENKKLGILSLGQPIVFNRLHASTETPIGVISVQKGMTLLATS